MKDRQIPYNISFVLFPVILGDAWLALLPSLLLFSFFPYFSLLSGSRVPHHYPFIRSLRIQAKVSWRNKMEECAPGNERASLRRKGFQENEERDKVIEGYRTERKDATSITARSFLVLAVAGK